MPNVVEAVPLAHAPPQNPAHGDAPLIPPQGVPATLWLGSILRFPFMAETRKGNLV